MTKPAGIFTLATTLTPDIVTEIIELSKRHHQTSKALYQTIFPETTTRRVTSSESWLHAQKQAHNHPETNLRELLNTLSEEQIQELKALLWMGRGDASGTVEAVFLGLKAHAKQTQNLDLDYVMSKPLALYLSESIRLSPSQLLN
jgi:hypothetical protein